MKQPKFKFGDKVVRRRPGRPAVIFVVEWTRLINGRIEYSSTATSVSYPEKDLELFQEPQKKKLYAYKHEGSAVRFDEIEHVNGIFSLNERLAFERAPNTTSTTRSLSNGTVIPRNCSQ